MKALNVLQVSIENQACYNFWHRLLHIDVSKVNFLNWPVTVYYTPISNISSESFMKACWSNHN